MNTSVSLKDDKKSLSSPAVRIVSWLFLLLIFPLVLFFLINQLDMFAVDRQIFAFFVVIVYLSLVFVINLFSRFPRLLILPIIFLWMAGVVCGFFQIDYIWLANDLPQIQNYLAEEAAAKLIGDSIIVGHPVNKFSFTDIASIAEIAAQNLKTFSHSALSTKLENYERVSNNWLSEIVDSTKNTSTWKNLPNQPADFQMSLNDNAAKKLFITSVGNIQTLKEFGDTAIKNKDKTTMLYIAAKLLVQKHWLNGILHAQKVNPLALNIFYIKPVMASTLALRTCSLGEGPFTSQLCTPDAPPCTPHCVMPSVQQPVQQAPAEPEVTEESTPISYNYSSKTRDVCLRGANGTYCVQATIQSVTEIEISAIGFAEDQPNAQKEWDDSWHYLETTSGVSPQSEPTDPTAEHSPTVQAFYDTCTARHSFVGGANQDKGRLPTTESGYHCSYIQDGNNCWDYLTLSGGRFMGGDVGCQELNLVPIAPHQQPTQPAAQPTNQNKSWAWDGAYIGVLSDCDQVSNAGINQVNVKSNQAEEANLYAAHGVSAPIGPDGHAQLTWNGTVVDFQFTRKGNVATVVFNQSFSSSFNSCTFRFEGTRQ